MLLYRLRTSQVVSSNMFIFSTPQITPLKISSRHRIEHHIENLKNHVTSLKELIVVARERFNVCQTDVLTVETLAQAINNINSNIENPDRQMQDDIRLATLKEELLQKSNKTDVMQLKISIDNQIQKLIELNKQNAEELERIKLIKMASCKTRYMQTILSKDQCLDNKKQNRMHSYQSSQPYIIFELDEIRKYQRQALLRSPYGTIPLYRRQAWVQIFQSNIQEINKS